MAEVVTDLSRFPTAGHLASWAGRCPGQNESAGKRRSGRTRKGSPALRDALTEAGRSRSSSNPRRLSGCPIPSDRREAGRQSSRSRSGALDPCNRVPLAYQGRYYENLGANYFDERDKAHPPLPRCRSHQTSRLRGHPCARRRVNFFGLGTSVRNAPKLTERNSPLVVRVCLVKGCPT